MRRMDRYNDDTSKLNRTEKNQDLYQDVVNNPKVANITDVTNANAFELSSREENQSSRESYQKMRKYGDFEEVPKIKKELDDINYLYPKKEKKIYDINSVLEAARKNRQGKDELEEKRKLKYTSYNIFSGINLEELAKYREEKKNREKTPKEEEIHELMDTIASKTLAGEISKEETVELLSDLMATNILDKVVPADEIGAEEEPQIITTQTVMVEEVKETPEEQTPELVTSEITSTSIETQEMTPPSENTQESKTIDKDFYTKSMDLSTKDLDLSDSLEDEEGISTFAKILIAILIIAILAVGAYFIYLKIK